MKAVYIKPFNKFLRHSVAYHLLPKRLFQTHHKTFAKSTKTEKIPKSEAKSKLELFFPSLKNKGIRNKVALVTGGTDSIGSECVRELLTCGAKGVMIADSNEQKGQDEVIAFSRQFGLEKVAFIKIEPDNYTLLKNAFISTTNYFKGLDIVVNNVRFREKNWDEQIDEYIKGLVLSTQLGMEFMGIHNGGKGGTLVNISSDYHSKSDSCPIFQAVQDFIVRFDSTVGVDSFKNSQVKVLTICKANPSTVSNNLSEIILKGSTGDVHIAK